MKHETAANHAGLITPTPDNPPLVEPIYQSVKFTTQTYEDLAAILDRRKEGYFYSRVSNPTVQQLESLLAKLQSRDASIAFSSGVAALWACFFSLLKAGDHVIIFLESYKPTRYLVRNLLARFGVRSSVLSIEDLDTLESEVRKNHTRLILFESPTNPMLKIADIRAITQIAGKAGVLTALDNTFAGFHNHGEFEVDFFIHSLTKFASGHGDVLGGAIIGDHARINAMRRDAFETGASLDPHAAFLILRGLKTYYLRYEKQAENAKSVALWLSNHPAIERVFYPGLDSHPQHALATEQMKSFGALVSFDLKESTAFAPFINKLRLFRIAASLGSTESLVAPVKLLFGTDLSDEECKIARITDRSVRLSVGIEAIDDLIADLAQALEGAFSKH